MKKCNSMNSITLKWANCMIYKHGYDRSEAFKKAHMVRKTLIMLAKGMVEFYFGKNDGSVRHARGTLCDGVSEKFDDWKRKQAEKPKDKEVEDDSAKHVIKYWDVDKEGFRSFKAENLLSLIASQEIK